MTVLQAVRIFGPATLHQLAARLHRRDLVRLDLELWALESHDWAFPSPGPDTEWDLTPLGVDEFEAQAARAKDEARLCQGAGA